VTVNKSLARLLGADGTPIGEGRSFIHLRLATDLPQAAQGTLSLDWWDEAGSTDQAQLELVDGPRLQPRLESDRLSSCMVGRILRFKVDWPGVATS
jgi:hypothetical protein